MKSLKKILFIILEALALIGLIAGLMFAFQFARAYLLPSNGNSRAAYYPLSEATQVSKPFPTYTSYPTRTPTPTPIVLDNGWYLYTDNEAGYSFSYPPDARLRTSKESGLDYRTARIQFHMSEADGYQGMVIDVLSNPQKLPVENIVQAIYTDQTQKPPIDVVKATLEQIEVAGIPAYKSTYQPSMFELTILLPYEDKVYFIVPVHDNLDTALDPKGLELFFQILGTFTLNP